MSVPAPLPPVPAPPVVHGSPRWAAPIFFALGLVLVPWTLWLAVSLPTRQLANHYDAAWSGFDVALAASLIATGLGLLRHATWTQSAGAAAATLLVCDAWFDVTLSAPGREQVIAAATAALVELPLAIACVIVARQSALVADRARGYVAYMRRLHPRGRRASSAREAVAMDSEPEDLPS